MAARDTEAGSNERGQSTIEYVGLVLVVALLLAGNAALAGVGLPGSGVARTVLGALACAVDEGHCDRVVAPRSAVEAQYGAAVAALLADRAPDVFFERDEFASLPVDFRR